MGCSAAFWSVPRLFWYFRGCLNLYAACYEGVTPSYNLTINLVWVRVTIDYQPRMGPRSNRGSTSYSTAYISLNLAETSRKHSQI